MINYITRIIFIVELGDIKVKKNQKQNQKKKKIIKIKIYKNIY